MPDRTLTRVLASVAAVWMTLAVDAMGGAGDWCLAFGVAGCSGLLMASGWVVLDRLADELRPSLVIILCAVLGAAVGMWLSTALGAPAKLHGPYRRLALIVLVGSLGGLACLGALFGYLVSALRLPGGRATTWTVPRRLGVSIGCLVVGVAAGAVDLHFLVGLYPEAHWVLRLVAVQCLLHALTLVPHARPGHVSCRPRVRTAVTAGLVGASVALTLLARDSGTLARLNREAYTGMYLGLVRELADLDRDGASALLGEDCDEWNRNVREGQLEIPGNGIDDNCQLGDGDPARHHERISLPPLPTASSQANVVLVVMDALRPDRTSLYGYSEDTTPSLKAWGGSARVFERAYTAGGWTGISLPPMSLGVWARRIQWTEYYYTLPHLRFLRVPLAEAVLPGEQAKEVLTFATHDAGQTVSELLRRRGMETIAVVDDGPGEILARGNFSRGFSRYIETDDLSPPRRDDRGTIDLALRALEEAPRDRAFFLWVHVFGVHGPSTRHAELPGWGQDESQHYDHEVLFADRQLSRLFEALDELDHPLPTTTILCGDHGERFTRDGRRFHGYALAREDVQVPLVVRGPGFAPGRVATPVTTVDIAPTILAITGTPAPPRLDGMDLRRVPVDEYRVVIADTWRYSDGERRTIDFTAALDGTLEVVRDLATDGTLTYELNTGRLLGHAEQQQRAAAERLTQALDEYLEGTAPPAAR